MGTNWLHLGSAPGPCCSLLYKARLSSARLAVSAFFLSFILFETRIILTCFSCALQWHMTYNINTYASWQLNLQWTRCWCHPYLFYQPPKSQGQVDWERRMHCDMEELYILKVDFIFVWKYSHDIQYCIQRMHINKFLTIIIKLVRKEASTYRQHKQYCKGPGQRERQKGVKNYNHMINHIS